MDYKVIKDSWDAGFRAGFYNEKPGNNAGFDRSVFNEGYAEGSRKRKGSPSKFFIDEAGQVQIDKKVRVENISARFFMEVTL